MAKRQLSEKSLRFRRASFRFFRAVTILTLLMAGMVGGLVVGLFASVMREMPNEGDLSDIRSPQPTRILAYDGTVLAKFYSENRDVVPYERMKHMVNATLAIEDVRYFTHPGIDPKGIARAAYKNFISGDIKEGASTITQQLARNLYLSRRQEVGRKFQEMIIALELERRYSKMEILEAYLNQTYYGSNTHGVQCYGAQMAAKNYFNKDVENLTIAEAALLAGQPKNPRDYNPYRSPDTAIRRRNQVLSSMVAHGYISAKQYQVALREPMQLAPEKKLVETADSTAPYFVRYIYSRDDCELRRIFGQDTNSLVYQYGVDIYTTLDSRMQDVAESTVREKVEASRGMRIDDGALIAIDPKTGFIKAMVGGTDFRKDQYNIVVQGSRQPGSSFKPFVYTTALLHGYTPQTPVNDSPGRYPSGTGQYWSPKNSDGGYRGRMPLERALWLSRNAAAASVAYDVGIDRIIDVAYAMGIKRPLSPYLSTSLGAAEVVPLEICSAYGTLANGGVLNPPTGIVRVVSADGGQLLYEHRPNPRRAIPTEIADTMQEVMRGVIERGTARRARIPYPASGKTGTTNSYRDAWFIGYTDNLVTAVWVGNRQNQPMSRVFGGTVPAPIWQEFMLVAQPIMMAEHQARQAELARANSLPELTKIDTTPTKYILGLRKKQTTHASVRQPRDEPVAPEAVDENSDTPVEQVEGAGEKTQALICSESGDRATASCPSTVLQTYTKGETPAPPTRTCTTHRARGETTAPRRAEGRTRDRDHEQGIVLSICAETGKIASEQCPIVIQRRYSAAKAPRETCPLHKR